MKKLYSFIFCLISLPFFAQSEKTMEHIDGLYVFEKVHFTVYNDRTNEEISTHLLSTPSSITAGEDVFYWNVFLEATIANNALVACTLLDDVNYNVINNLELIAAKEELLSDEVHLKAHVVLTPYVMEKKGDQLVFIAEFSYGNSQYSFPLKGKLLFTMTKKG